jgi:cyclophilin family peptidyl-prolyl cis-trans isomerase
MNKHFLMMGSVAIMAMLSVSCSRPTAMFSYRGEERAPARVQFENVSENAESFEWRFGDGDTSMQISPQHRFMESGEYSVQLTAIKGKKKRMVEKVVKIAPPRFCLAEIQTDFGNMIVLLDDAAPQHRDNFLKLADEGFYDSLLFHRVIEGFMIQGGDPISKEAAPNQPLGSGGPGYTLPAEFVDTLAHIKGTIAAARRGGPSNPQKRSSGSQFYIVQGRPVTDAQLNQMEAEKGIRYSRKIREAYKELGGTPVLDQEYTVFGRVIEGLEVIDKIAAQRTARGDRPLEDVIMKIRVIK